MKNLTFIAILQICFYFLSSCENKTQQNELTIEQSSPPEISQEFKLFTSNLYKDNYIFKNLNFIDGTLDDALQQARQQDKYLYVVTSMDRWTALDRMLRIMDLNRKESIKQKIFNEVLFYKCYYSNDEN